MGALLSEWNIVLDELRYKPNQVVISPTYGEFVYLKELFGIDGKVLGLTDCCFYDQPCDRHKQAKPKDGE